MIRIMLVVIAFIIWMEGSDRLLYAFNHPWFIGEAMISLVVMLAWTMLYSYVTIKLVTRIREGK